MVTGQPLLTPWAQWGSIFLKALTLSGYLLAFTGDYPKSSRNLPKWNLSVVLNGLTKAPFVRMKDTDLKHLTLKTAFLLALASGKHHSEIYTWVANKVSNLGHWEKVASVPLFRFHSQMPSNSRFSKCVSGDYLLVSLLSFISVTVFNMYNVLSTYSGDPIISS